MTLTMLLDDKKSQGRRQSFAAHRRPQEEGAREMDYAKEPWPQGVTHTKNRGQGQRQRGPGVQTIWTTRRGPGERVFHETLILRRGTAGVIAPNMRGST